MPYTSYVSYADQGKAHNDWAEEVAKEYSRKKSSYSRFYPTQKPKKTNEKKEIPKISEEKKRKFQQKMADAQAEYQRALKAKQVSRLSEEKSRYERQWNKLLDHTLESDTQLEYEDIPWPHCQGGSLEDVLRF